MGAGVCSEVEAAPQGPPFRITRAKHHCAHARLDQGTGTHGAWLQGHQQGAIGETPGVQRRSGLAQGHQLCMAKGILPVVPAIDAPAHSPSPPIEHHRRHGHFPQGADLASPAQQALHPQPMVLHGVHAPLLPSKKESALAAAEWVSARWACPIPFLPFAEQPLEPLAPPSTPASLAPFADPLGPDPLLEEVLHQAAGLLCRWLGRAAAQPPLPGLSVLPAVEPEVNGLPPDRLLADLQVVMDGAYQPGHPGALAHLDPPPLTASIVAELIAAGLNNNLLADELSPSLRRLERSLCAVLAQRLGLPSGAGGVPASGGTLSNLMALVTARQARCPQAGQEGVVVCSADAHVSLVKAMRVMGLPPEALHRLPVDAEGGMQPEALDHHLTQLAQQGVPVIAVVATAGTTVRGAIDPLEAIARLCQRHGHWLHVDGAIGAVFALVPQTQALLAGIGQADSITLNPQKVIGITKTSSLLLVAHPASLQAAFHTGLPYMEPSWGGGHGGEEGLQGTRPAEILKLWLGLRQLGWQGVETLLAGALQRQRQLEALLVGESRLLLQSGSLHLLAFRVEGADPALTDLWSQTTRQALLEHRLMLSRPHYQGHHHLKAVLGNPHTSPAHLEQLARVVRHSLPIVSPR